MAQLTHRTLTGLIALAALVTMAACNGSDPDVKKQASASGIADQAAAELSSMDMTKEEMASVAQAKQMGLDDASIVQIVKLVHKRDLKFDIGATLGALKQLGVGPTAIIQLVEIDAVPRMEADVRALKEASVGDVTIVEIAKMRMVQKKDLLSGPEYASLKTFGLSDPGLMKFIEHGGTSQQVQTLAKQLALGKPEPEALKSVGM